MKTILYILICLILIPLRDAKAANFYYDTQNISRGETSEIRLYLDTEGADINTVEAKINFPANSMLVETLSDGESLIPLWIEKPNFNNNDGKISFSGIIPGGFSGKGLLLKILINPSAENNISFMLNKATVLLNNGEATETTIKTSGIITRGDKLSAQTSDTYPPESFTPELTKIENVSNGKWVVVWSTVDKNSGIDRYEILETSPNKTYDWEKAESPHEIKDQNLTSDIFVRAIDHAGNFTISKIPAKNPQIPYNKNILGIIGGTLLILLIVIINFLPKKRNGTKFS